MRTKDTYITYKASWGNEDVERIFDETNPQWKLSVESNRSFLVLQEQYLNHLLRMYGFVFLNDVFVALGYPRTPIGQLLGWLKDGRGNQYIAFNIEEIDGTSNLKLKFNVDGVIINDFFKDNQWLSPR